MIANPGFAVAAVVIGCLSAITSAQAQDGTYSSVYSDISRAKCRVIKAGTSNGRDEHEKIVHRCPTKLGFEVTKTYLGAAMQVTIAKPSSAGSRPQLGAGYDAGDRIEWRGVKTKTGFVPQAAILRLTSRNEQGRLQSVLAILRVENDRVCPAAWLDVGANPQPNDLARKSADGIVGMFRCGASDPTIIGTATELVKDIAARSPSPK